VFTAFLPASASALSYEQCRTIAAITSQVVKTAGKDRLSSAFRNSMIQYVAPDGKIACTGSKEIQTPHGPDIDAFNTIRGLLLTDGISLEKGGLRAVATPASQPAAKRK
jgi:hypothetical protein